MFTDSHTHLYLKEFDKDVATVIKNAVVNRFLLPNIDLNSIPKLLALCKDEKSNLFPMIGLHPCSVSKNFINDLDKIYSYFNADSFIAIGEIGIDLYWENKFIIEQQEAFQIQLNWARQHKLPIVIHSRNSFNEIYTILKKKKNNDITGVFHCFSGSYQQAKKIIEMGFYLGIGGVLTFKNSNLSEVIKKIDLKHLILETDSPYLAPSPMRGKRNEPKFLPIIAKQIAEIKNINIQEIAEITNQNIDDIFFKIK
jgi:TatD DNase family protein